MDLTNKKNVLVAEDEPEIRSLLETILSEKYNVQLVTNGLEAVAAARSSKPDAILMDIMMPEMDGVTAVEHIRSDAGTKHIPILMLTAANSTQERIRAFNFGADDFIAKPFDCEELLTRIESKLLRIETFRHAPPERIEVANLIMDLKSHEVSLSGKILDLSPVEFGILQLLLVRMGEVVSRKEIMKEVWEDGRKSDRLIDAHVTSLRKKIDGFKCDFHTVYGEGYRMKALLV